jgi:hypothetical protein
MSERAQEIFDATLPYTLRPKSGDRKRVVSAILRKAADRLCTDWAELKHPADVLREIADEVEGSTW